MDKKKFRAAAQKEFEKWLELNKGWITTLELAGIDEDILKSELKDCFVEGMKYGVEVVKNKIGS